MTWHRLDDADHWPALHEKVLVAGESAQLCIAWRQPLEAGGWRWESDHTAWTFEPFEMWAPIMWPDPLPRSPSNEETNG